MILPIRSNQGIVNCRASSRSAAGLHRQRKKNKWLSRHIKNSERWVVTGQVNAVKKATSPARRVGHYAKRQAASRKQQEQEESKYMYEIV